MSSDTIQCATIREGLDVPFKGRSTGDVELSAGYIHTRELHVSNDAKLVKTLINFKHTTAKIIPLTRDILILLAAE